MTLSHDDPKLTAFVLGELDEAERAEIELELERSPQLRRSVDEIRSVTDALAVQLKLEPLPQPNAACRADIDAHFGWHGQASTLKADERRHAGAGLNMPAPATSGLGHATRLRRLLIPLSLAASVALVFGITHYGLPELSRARESSKRLVTAISTKSLGTSAKVYSEVFASGEAYLFFDKSSTNADVNHFIAPPSGDRLAFAPAPRARPARKERAAGPGGGMVRSEPAGPPMTEEAKQQLGASRVYASYDHVTAVVNPRSLSDAERANLKSTLASLGYVSGSTPSDPASWGIPVHSSSSADGSRIHGFAPGTKAKIFFDTTEGVYWIESDEEPVDELEESLEDLKEELAFRDKVTAEAYSSISENPFLEVLRNPLSTFSIDVDTASYSNVRRFLQAGTLPPRDAVRIEELINYFDYNYPPPTNEHPFSVNVEVAECPWAPQHRLARIGIKGMEFSDRDRPAANLVFLIDVSGSMQPANRLPLVRESLGLLVDRLRRQDSVAMVVYAGASGLVLPATNGSNHAAILAAIERLQAGGSTNGGAGIQLAYDTAIQHFIEGGVNRVILATDGDFNVGLSNREELQRLIEDKAKSGVFLSVLGYGMGNLKDATLEMLADKGNGNYAYIDTINEAQKVLVDQMGGTLVTIAKDVKIQVEFNPAHVGSYRLIGYENRMLAAQDFNDDRKDAGEIGAGHTVTALYEIVPAGLTPPDDAPSIDPLKYQYSAGDAPSPSDRISAVAEEGRGEGDEHQYRDRQGAGLDEEKDAEVDEPIDNRLTPAAASGELMTVKLRYKEPDEDVSKLIEVPVIDSGAAFEESSDDFAFAAAVASFGMLLRQSSYSKTFGANPTDAIDLFDFDFVREVAAGASGVDPFGYRSEFLQLVDKAKSLSAAAP